MDVFLNISWLAIKTLATPDVLQFRSKYGKVGICPKWSWGKQFQRSVCPGEDALS